MYSTYTSHYWPEPGVRLAVSQSDSQYRSQMIFTQPASKSFDLPLVTMDLPPAWSQTCVCGCAFSLLQAYTFHQCSCQRTKKRLLGALEKAKDILQARKCRKVESGRSVLPAQNLLAEAGPTSQLVELAHSNDLPIPVVHSEVRFPFITYSSLINIFSISEPHGYCQEL